VETYAQIRDGKLGEYPYENGLAGPRTTSGAWQGPEPTDYLTSGLKPQMITAAELLCKAMRDINLPFTTLDRVDLINANQVYLTPSSHHPLHTTLFTPSP